MRGPFLGTIREGGAYPEPWDDNWIRPGCRFCPECRTDTRIQRVTTSYDYHIEHVTMVCSRCGGEVFRFDVLMEGNFTFEQLPAGAT